MFALAPDQEWHLYYCVHVHPREAGRLLCLQRVHLQPVHYPQRCTSKLFCATAGAKNYWQNILSISRDAAAAEIGIAQNLLSLSHSPRWLNGLEMIHRAVQVRGESCKEVKKIWPLELLKLSSESFWSVWIMNDICWAAELLDNCQRKMEVVFSRQNRSFNQSIMYFMFPRNLCCIRETRSHFCLVHLKYLFKKL